MATKRKVVPRKVWSLEIEERMVEMWQEHPCLFDISDISYHDRSWKEQRWREIALQLQVPGLLQSAHSFRDNAFAPSTRSSYSTTWSSFTHNRISLTTYNLQHLLAFITYLRLSLNLAPSSIKNYLSGIQHQFCLQYPSMLLSIPVVRLRVSHPPPHQDNQSHRISSFASSPPSVAAASPFSMASSWKLHA
ncbi:hypothetical protein EOD39_17113 [Acipenser ruthenus]|uniref:MADF domain-containing protein n=1 Tax=Acipenser ruthenus TaxID=7906 RepID=A0A444V4A1_ACIRT|nr:hypothetical protein EOD39_17113 [Acipenser ruthenus]